MIERRTAAVARLWRMDASANGRISIAELRTDIDARRETLARLHALVDGAQLLAEILADLDRLDLPAPPPPQLLTVAAAARQTGWSADHLARMVRSGEVQNFGRLRAPRVRLEDVPVKAVGVARRRAVLPPSTSNGRASSTGEPV